MSGNIIVKILGSVDMLSAFTFLMIIFGIQPWVQLLLFCSGLLFLKGLFIFNGDVLSVVDIVASMALIVAIFVTPWAFISWSVAFLLLSKGIVSFI